MRQQRATRGLPARDSELLELLCSMSVIFAPDWLRGKAKVNQETIQRVSDREPETWCRRFLQGPDCGGDSMWVGEGMGAGSPAWDLHLRNPCASPSPIFQLLEENDQLIRCIVEYQNKGRAKECVQ